MKRPAIITLVAVWFAVSAIILVQLAMSRYAEFTAEWYPTYLGVAALPYLVSAVGLWRMKKWGVIVFIVFSVINQAVLVLVNQWTFTSLVTSGLLVAVCWSQYSKMK
jgi:hypothetical protein